jgi:glucuronate isomerase
MNNMTSVKKNLHPERFFSSNKIQRNLAIKIFKSIENLPIVSPHGHINIDIFLDDQRDLGNPVDLFIRSDQYVFRRLHSYGVSLDDIGISNDPNQSSQIDPRKIWQVFCDHYFLFIGTPTGAWIDYVLDNVFGIEHKISGKFAQSIYDHLLEKIKSDEFIPRNLFKKFNIEVLSTTDSPIDTLEKHLSIRNSGWNGSIIPTFRPDGILSPFIGILPQYEVSTIFQKALKRKVSSTETNIFSSYMLYEMAMMSTEDGMVMQIHPGSFRNHHTVIYRKYGPDKGFDIPIPIEFTQNLRPLL